MTVVDLAIRRFRSGDEAKAYEVCLRTGDAGTDATLIYDDPELLGHVYAGPYFALAPEFAFMLVDETDAVVGYALGTPDTAAFSLACERVWWPALRERYAPGLRRASDANLVRLIHQPSSIPDEIVADYPAHLHIDLLPAAQGAGHGRALMDRLLDEFAATGAHGVHLGVATANVQAIGFYQRLGFTALARHAAGQLMVKRLSGPAPRPERQARPRGQSVRPGLAARASDPARTMTASRHRRGDGGVSPTGLSRPSTIDPARTDP